MNKQSADQTARMRLCYPHRQDGRRSHDEGHNRENSEEVVTIYLFIVLLYIPFIRNGRLRVLLYFLQLALKGGMEGQYLLRYDTLSKNVSHVLYKALYHKY